MLVDEGKVGKLHPLREEQVRKAAHAHRWEGRGGVRVQVRVGGGVGARGHGPGEDGDTPTVGGHQRGLEE